jgi:hypothetical protein
MNLSHWGLLFMIPDEKLSLLFRRLRTSELRQSLSVPPVPERINCIRPQVRELCNDCTSAAVFGGKQYLH